MIDPAIVLVSVDDLAPAIEFYLRPLRAEIAHLQRDLTARTLRLDDALTERDRALLERDELAGEVQARTVERDEAREQLQRIGRKAFWAATHDSEPRPAPARRRSAARADTPLERPALP